MFKRKNENYSPVVSAGTRSPKGFLLISIIAALCADVCVSAILIWSAVPVLYWIFPVLAMAADALFLLCAVFTNFRFKYSVGELCAFVVFICAIAVAENVVNLTGETVTLSVAAAVMWTASHLLSVICVVATAVHASKRIRGNKIAKIIAASLFCALAAVCAVFYGLYVFGGGFFGQGGYGVRPLEYVYNEVTDSYSVAGVMQGRGEIVVIPETFNDKKVDGVSYKVFCAEGVTDVHMASADVKFTDAEELSHFGGEINIHADKEDVETLRGAFYSARGTTFKAYDLANCVVPNVDADEVYVAFAYDQDSYAAVNGKVLPIWTGKKGDEFRLLFTYYENYSYIRYNSSSDESGLYESYTGFGGKVLKELKFFDPSKEVEGDVVSGWGAEGNTVLDGAVINDSVKVKVEFENVYRIKVQNDNDTKYEPGAIFKSLYTGGQFVGYRYATAATFDGVLNEINDSRQGFTLSYNYGLTATENGQPYRGFENSVSGSVSSLTSNTVYIYPVWDLNAPTITSATSNAAGGKIVYGEDLEIKAAATAPVDGMNVAYAWSGAYTTSSQSFKIQRVGLNDGGDFNLTVTVSGDNTSLTSQAKASLTVEVTKRPVYLDWTGTEAVTYNGAEHSISFEVRARQTGSGLLDDDGVSVHIYSQNSFPVNIGTSSATFKNAGAYTVGGRLNNVAAADNYYIVSSTESVQKVINKAPLDITWTGTSEFVYDKTLHAPEYTVSGGFGSDDTMISIDGASIYANAYTNTQYYTATAVTSNSNYYITENTKSRRFTIAQREVTLSWLTDTIGYTGEELAPLVVLSSDNLIDGDALRLSRTGFQRNTNEYTGIPEYIATAVVGNRNYKATAATATKKFKIVPRNVSFVWDSAASFEYNGAVQYPKVTDIDGAVATELEALKASISYTGGGKDVAGGSYTAFATLLNKNYSVVESSRTSGYYTITPKGITVTFTQSVMPYMGTTMTPTHSIDGRIGNDNVGLVLDGRGENAGDYTITPRATNANYKVVSEPFNYTITKAPIAFEWTSGALVYNGRVHSPVPTINGTIYPRDQIEIVCTYDKPDANRKNIGQFTATAKLVSKIPSRPADNYEIISGATNEFFINYVQLEISVSNTNLVYNGYAQAPAVEIKNKSAIVEGDVLELVVTGGGTEVGSYTLTVKLKNNNSEPAKNYKLKYENQFDLEISVNFNIIAPDARRIDFAEGGKSFYEEVAEARAEGGSL